MKIRFLLLAAATAGLVFAQGPHPRIGFGPDGPDAEGRLSRTLNLTAAQQNIVHTALQEHRVQTQGPREQAHTLQTQLHDAIKSGVPDQIEKVTAQLGTLHQQELSAQAKTAAKIYSTLTPDQKTQIGDHLEMLMGGPGMGGHGMRGRGPKPAAPGSQNQ